MGNSLFKFFGEIVIKSDKAKQELDDTAKKASDSSTKIVDAFKKIGTAVVTYFSIKQISAFGEECIRAASDAQEMQNKFDVVFQGMSAEVEEWANTFAESIGRNSTTIKGYLADNQNMFVGMGMSREEAAGLSEDLVSLALDLASFNNLNEDEAVQAMSKALMGETESAKRLGAVLNDNTRAMAMEALGYEGKFDALSETQKMEVNYQAVLMQSTDAVGDCVRSLDSYKGQTIQLNSAKQKLKETIGSMLLPAMTKLVSVLTTIVGGTQKAVQWLSEHQTVAIVLAVAVGTLATAIIAYNIAQNAAAIAATVSAVATGAFGAAVAFLTSPITLVIVAIGALIAVVVALCKNWDTVKEIGSKCWEGIKGAWEKSSDWMDENVIQPMAEFYSQLWGKIQEGASNAASFMAERFPEAWAAIQAVWDIVSGYFEQIWSSIKSIFAAVESVFRGDFEGAWDAIKGIVDGWKEYFQGVWDSICSVFQNATEIGKKIVDDIKEGIASAWDSLTAWFSGIWDSLFGGLSVDVSATGTASGGVDGSHASGLWSVPFDGYIAELHKDEMVVPAAEAAVIRGGNGFGGGEVVAVLSDILMQLRINNQQSTEIRINNREFGRLVKAVV